MLSVHFNKEFFINALKANKNMVTFLSTTIALMLTLLIQGLMQGNLRLEYFGYALIVSMAFFIWSVVDTKYRSKKCESCLEE